MPSARREIRKRNLLRAGREAPHESDDASVGFNSRFRRITDLVMQPSDVKQLVEILRVKAPASYCFSCLGLVFNETSSAIKSLVRALMMYGTPLRVAAGSCVQCGKCDSVVSHQRPSP